MVGVALHHAAEDQVAVMAAPLPLGVQGHAQRRRQLEGARDVHHLGPGADLLQHRQAGRVDAVVIGQQHAIDDARARSFGWR